MRYYLIAGEASGDLHASNLMRAILERDKDAVFRYFGGDLMQAVGGTLVKHYRELAYMGFIPVLMNARTILRNRELCKQDIEAFRPDRVILVDYPGFNLNIAKHLKKHPIESDPRVVYYISPKIWAWKTYRIRSIKKYIDQMLCILPFEVDFYKKYDYPIDYVGNPTVDAVVDFQKKSVAEAPLAFPTNKPVVALLAGSRRQEIKDNLSVMLKAALPFDGYQLVIAGAPGIEPSYYDSFLQGLPVTIVYNQTYALLQQSHAALVTSGTATLETALFGVPQTVCYKTPVKHLVTFIFNHFFSCRYISLVNLIAGKTVVQELFGKYFSEKQIYDELSRILNDEPYRGEMLAQYDDVARILGAPGASERAAGLICR